MPPVVTVNRHSHTDDEESETIDLSDDDHSRTEDEETDDGEDDEDYSDDGDIHEDLTASSLAEDSWQNLDTDVENSIIEPSDSASRTRHPAALPRSASQRYHPAPPRPAGRRAKSSRDFTVVPEPPSASLPRRGSKRPTRSRSGLEGPMEDDGYGPYGGGYGRHGSLPHHPPSGNWDPYSASRSTVSGYDDQYMPHEAINHFVMPPEHGYQGGRRGQRMAMPSRAQSAGHELMTVGHYGAHHYNPYGMPPGYLPYGGHPGYPGYYPPHHSGPSSKRGTPAPDDSRSDPALADLKQMMEDSRKREQARLEAEDKKALAAKDAEASSKLKAEEDKFAALQQLIMKTSAEQSEREKRNETARLAEAAAKAAAEARAVEEKKRADDKDKEIKHAKEQAKMEAEKEAQKKADEEKAKHEKALEEVKKKAAELEEAKKKFEDEAKSLRPKDDMLKAPIRFQDAVGRKFNFPWSMCKTWKGMEGLILQAFKHIQDLGPAVKESMYDLIGPDNEIILPQVWETMVKPDMSIKMQMWPQTEKKKFHTMPHPGHPQFQGMDPRHLNALLAGPSGKKDKDGKKKDRDLEKAMRQMNMVPPPPPPVGSLLGGMMAPPPPPPGVGFPMPPGVVDTSKKAKSSSGKKKSSSSKGGFLGFLGGGSAPVKKETTRRKK